MKTQKWIDKLLASPATSECVLWPFATDGTGYPYMKRNSKSIAVHRYICRITNGNPPSKQHNNAAHFCGNKICVNPLHLRWATHAENCADRKRHGTEPSRLGELNPRAKLTAEDIPLIRELLRTGMVRREIAEMFGVSRATILGIQSGRCWSHV